MVSRVKKVDEGKWANEGYRRLEIEVWKESGDTQECARKWQREKVIKGGLKQVEISCVVDGVKSQEGGCRKVRSRR